MRAIELLVRFRPLLVFFLVFACGLSFPQTYPVKEVDSLLKAGINCIIIQNYSKANVIFTKLDHEYPSIPLGKIYLAAASIAKSYDNAEEYDAYLIMNNLSIAKDMSEKLMDTANANIWYHYFDALAIGYRAYYNALNENWVTAFSSGLSSVNEFNNCLDIDKNFYDALIATGSYKYWRSRKTEYFNWLPFVSDERDLGISYLEHAIAKTSYNTYLAELSLIWIFIDKGFYAEAVKIGEKSVQNAPEARIFKWALARAYEDVDTLKAVDTYQQILKSYGDINKTNHVNEVVLKHKIAQLYYRMGKYNESLNYCNEILSLKKLNKYASERLKNRLEKVKSLAAAIKEHSK